VDGRNFLLILPLIDSAPTSLPFHPGHQDRGNNAYTDASLQVHQADEGADWDQLKAAEGGPQSASAFSNVLNGKTLKIVTQGGPTLEYKFGTNRRLTLTEAASRSQPDTAS
jgi:hypothetical protein